MDSKLFLIVDDDPAVVFALTQFFNMHDYFVFAVNSGFHALEVLKFLNVDVIVYDYEMPEMNGLEFLQDVKNKYPKIPIIMLSGYEDSDVINQAIQLSAEAFLSKSVDFQLLLNTIKIKSLWGQFPAPWGANFIHKEGF